MKLLSSIVFIAFLVASSAGAAELLKADNFDEKVTGNVDAFVKFMAPWCGHCKKMKPAWDKLASQFGYTYGIYDVDCTAEQALCQANGVRGYPTVKYFVGGDPEGKKYPGSRDFDALVEFVKNNFKEAR